MMEVAGQVAQWFSAYWPRPGVPPSIAALAAATQREYSMMLYLLAILIELAALLFAWALCRAAGRG